MRLKSLIRKSVPKVPSDSTGQQRRFAEAVSDNLDTLTGRRGNLIDRAVTFRDLIEVGILKKSSSLTTYGGGGGGTTDVTPDDDEDGVDQPTTPTTLTATGGFGFIQLNWQLTRYAGHDYVEIYRAQKTGTAIPTLSDAQAGGVYDRYYGDTYFYQDTRVGSNETYYYWVRAVNRNGVVSGFSDAANATTAIDYIHVSGLIDDILDDDVNTLGLNTALSNASGGGVGTPAVWNSTTTYAKDKLVTHSGRIYRASQASTNQTPSSSSSYWTDIGAYTVMADFVTAAQDEAVSTSATLETFQTNQAATNSAVSSDITALENTVNDSTTGVNATATAVSGLSTSVGYNASTGVSSLAQDVTALSSTVNDQTTGVAVTASAVNGIQGKYSVKIDNNGNVAGFGLISTANTGVPTTGTGSAFIIAADRFAISADYNTSETALSSVDKYPFKVFTVNTQVNGETIPPGVYIKDAYIHDAQITDAKIKDATITSAKIVGLEAGKITSGNIQINNANNIAIYQGKTSWADNTNPGFWLGNLNGYGSFSIGSSTSYLRFNGGGTAGVEASGLEIKASDGTVLVDAGGVYTSTGGNLAFNPNFRRGSGQSVDGWEEYSGSVSLFRRDLGYVRVGDGTNQSYVRQNTQRFPVVPGENLYVHAQTGSATGLFMAVAFYDHPDGAVTTGFAAQVSASHGSSNFDNETVTGAGGASRNLGVAKITVPTNASAQFGELRFGSDTGAQIYFFDVGVSRTPVVIGPKYAPTYIRDLSVDTLQIAGNAVTVPIGKDDVNKNDWVAYSGVSTDTGIGTTWGRASHTGSADQQTAVPLSWDDADKAPTAINLIGCINVLGQSGSAHKTVRVRLVYSTSPTFSSNVVQVQQVGGSQRTDHSATYSLNATLDVSDAGLLPNTNYYFGMQVHANDQVNGTAPYKIGSNGLTVLAAKK